jgi:hypothetical protein
MYVYHVLDIQYDTVPGIRAARMHDCHTKSKGHAQNLPMANRMDDISNGGLTPGRQGHVACKNLAETRRECTNGGNGGNESLTI